MESIGERLRRIRGERSQEEFAAALGVVKNSLARYERNERTPDASFFQRLLELGYNPNWVLSGIGSETGGIVEVEDSDTARFKMPIKPDVDWVMVKRYDVRAAAGNGALNADQVTVDELAFRRQYLDFIGVFKDKAAIVRVRGDSMEPLLKDGDTVLVDTSDTTILPLQRDDSRRRAYVIVQSSVDGDALRCKFVHSVRENGSEFTQIASLNPDYPPETVKIGQVRIVGRIRWHGHTWF